MKTDLAGSGGESGGRYLGLMLQEKTTRMEKPKGEEGSTTKVKLVQRGNLSPL